MYRLENPAQQAFRQKTREWLAENKPEGTMPVAETAAGSRQHIVWEKKLHEAGLGAITWPREYGGADLDLWHYLIFEEEYFRAGLPQRLTINGLSLLAPALLDFGTPEQKAKYLPRMVAVEDIWCQGWSEPEAGSDLASVRSTAVRDDARGGWVLNGQKTWSTRGAFSNRLFGLFRTGEPGTRHKGLTYFLVDLDQPAVTVSPVAKIDGTDGFADIFFDGAFVSDDDVLGQVGQGWSVAMSTAGNERSLSLRSPARFLYAVERLIELYHDATLEIRSDDSIREAIADVWMRAREYDLGTTSTVEAILAGESLGADSSLSKVFWSELDIDIHQVALSVAQGDPGVDDPWMNGYLFSLSGPIYAGTNQIQRSIIGERILGLPRK
jgi:alkylation response protein AidB-like acyl-CoA dehydrogenase